MGSGPIVMTGATGEIGGRVSRRLAERGVAQRMIVRDANRAPALEGSEVVVASSYLDAEGIERAVQGAETMFLVSGRESEDRLAQHFAAIDAARTGGIERIVYLSFLNAAPDATFTLGRQHFATEQHIRDSGARSTFLRSSLYADFVPYFAGHDGVIRGPAGDGAVSWIGRDDIAAVAATVLAAAASGDETHDGATYANTGPAALSLAETAATLARVTGRSISYQEETVEEAWASRRPSGAPDWEIEGWITSYQAIGAGELSTVTDDVERVTGTAAESLELFLRARPELWAHLSMDT